MRTKIEIDTRTFVRFWLVVIGMGLAILLIYNARIALLILGISAFLALALNSTVAKLSHRLPGRSRVAATAIAYVAVIVVIGAVIFLVIPPIVQQTAKFAQNVPSIVDSATHSWDGLRSFLKEYNLQPQLDTFFESIKNSAGAWAGSVGHNVVGAIGSVFSFLAGLILVLVLTFLMLIEGPEWLNRIWRLYSDKKKMHYHKRVLGSIYGVINGYITGQLTVSAIGAATAGVGVFILSLIFPSVPGGLAMPTAAITFLLSLIPMFGATIGGVIITILLALNSIPAAIIYAIFFVVYQQVENNFVSPKIQSKKNNLSALMILSSVTIGVYLFGIVGGIIAIPIAGSIRILIEEYLESRGESDDEAESEKSKVVLIKTTKKKA